MVHGVDPDRHLKPLKAIGECSSGDFQGDGGTLRFSLLLPAHYNGLHHRMTSPTTFGVFKMVGETSLRFLRF